MGGRLCALGVITTLALAASASAAPTHQEITFSRDGRIVSTDAAGRPPTPLVPRGAAGYLGDSDPTWDPTGQTLFFVRGRRTGPDREAYQVFSMRPGQAPRPLTPTRAGYEFGPAVSPDGTQIAFGRLTNGRRSSTGRVIIRSLATGAERTVAKARIDLGGIGAPAWAPDGKALLYTKTGIDKSYYFRSQIHSIRSDGSGDRILRRDANGGRYSPDGTLIAFVSNADHNGLTCGSDECEYNTEAYVMNANGSAPRRLTHTIPSEGQPEWSRDGARLVFSSSRNNPVTEYGNSEIYSMTPDGGCLTWLTNGTASSGSPSWRPGPGAAAPLACGGSGRPVLYATSERTLKSVKSFRPLWLGREHGDQWMSHAERSTYGIWVFYEDCGLFDPTGCGSPVQLTQQSVCDRDALRTLGATPLRAYRGALVELPQRTTEAFGGYGDYVVYSDGGSVAITLQGPAPRGKAAVLRILRKALDALRTYPDGTPAENLPRARLPLGTVSRARRAARLRKALGSVRAVARATGSSPRVVRQRLVLARALHKVRLGRPLRCGKS